MEDKNGKFFDSVCNFFRGDDRIPWCDSCVVDGFERDAKKDWDDKLKSEGMMRLSWALVHSKRPQDVLRGIGMLQAILALSSNSPLLDREKIYFMAVGYYRSGDYSRSKQLVERCLEIAPMWRQAAILKKAIEDKITKDRVIGIGIATTAVGLLAGGIAALLGRNK